MAPGDFERRGHILPRRASGLRSRQTSASAAVASNPGRKVCDRAAGQIRSFEPAARGESAKC
eukprot:6948711-Lingulodinium_polyedra.AAC.1